MPFTSHSRVCFSTRTGFPYTDDCPMIEALRSGECLVFPAGSRDGALPVFTGSVADAVAKADATLLPSVGAARDGTAEDDAA